MTRAPATAEWFSMSAVPLRANSDPPVEVIGSIARFDDNSQGDCVADGLRRPLQGVSKGPVAKTVAGLMADHRRPQEELVVDGTAQLLAAPGGGDLDRLDADLRLMGREKQVGGKAAGERASRQRQDAHDHCQW